MGRHAVRIEHHVVPPAAPLIALLAQEVMHLIGLILIDVECAEIEFNPSRLRIVGIQIDHRQHDILGCGIVLQVRNQLIVVDGAKRQATVGLQCRVVAAYAVDARYQRP